MAKEIAKENAVNAVVDALQRLKEEEAELQAKLKPVQEAVAALEKIVEKFSGVKKAKPAKDKTSENGSAEEAPELALEAQ
ncbi:hypothetical protein KK083_03615 [Fulvivirgaceae bacterium PWU4]|uniref:Uncharacterized protein n=1 Tax=Chryseosolibacter histidini TaxID=2782349 RepID=A0AAP2GHD6_9BACT|nr:hypothetical protein [Chryseosolibacter histidini]MBT1695949.1 hypothetical protein [Chryseosolibacter histidini]